MDRTQHATEIAAAAAAASGANKIAAAGVAALQERRHYTGIEVTRHYHEVSVQRLQELPPLV